MFIFVWVRSSRGEGVQSRVRVPRRVLENSLKKCDVLKSTMFVKFSLTKDDANKIEIIQIINELVCYKDIITN